MVIWKWWHPDAGDFFTVGDKAMVNFEKLKNGKNCVTY